MTRTEAIFDWIFSLPATHSVSHSQARKSKQDRYHLYYLASPDTGLSADAVDARARKESQSLKQVQEHAAQYTTLPDVWAFLTHHHGLYTTGQLVDRARGKQQKDGSADMADLVKKSYGAT